MSDTSALLQSLIYTAQRAGGAIMAVYATDFAVRDKADTSPVTAADEAAEKIILADLAAIAPGIPVVAEEAVAAGKVPVIADRFFLVDPLDGTLFGPEQHCFGCAPDHPIGFRLSFARDGDGVVTRFVPSDRYEGPPGVMHGGLVMALADEIGAWAVIAKTGKFGFTATIDGRLKRPVRIGVEVVGRARLIKETRRVVTASVTIEQSGEPMFEGELRFALLDESTAEKVLGPLREEWKRFSR